jgi:hypothetical protein
MLALGAGLAGIVLPLVPTTPFLLLASYCFLVSSPRWHRWLREHRWFGPLLADWEQRGGIRPRVKLLAVTTVLMVVALSAASGRLSTVGLVVLSVLAGVGLLVIARVPTVREPSATQAAAPPPLWEPE